MRSLDAESRIRSGEPKGDVKRPEKLFLIPDNSPEAVCRAFIAADIDWMFRRAVIYTDYGLLVPGCIYQVYQDLLGYPAPCCACGTFRLDYGFEADVWVGTGNNRALIGMGFTRDMELWVDGELQDYGDDWMVLSENVIDFWGSGVDAILGQVFHYEVRKGALSDTWDTLPAMAAPPQHTTTSVTPSSLVNPIGTTFEIVLHGTNFVHTDQLAVTPPGQYFYSLVQTTFIDDTELRGMFTWPVEDASWDDPGNAQVWADRYPLLNPNKQYIAVTYA